jgi:hypothetical protein
VTYAPEVVNVVDAHISSPLDNARSQRHEAVTALLLAAGAVPGSHPTLAAERSKMRAWVKEEHDRVRHAARLTVLEQLPETLHWQEMTAVATVLSTLVQVTDPSWAQCRPPGPNVRIVCCCIDD